MEIALLTILSTAGYIAMTAGTARLAYRIKWWDTLRDKEDVVGLSFTIGVVWWMTLIYILCRAVILLPGRNEREEARKTARAVSLARAERELAEATAQLSKLKASPDRTPVHATHSVYETYRYEQQRLKDRNNKSRRY